MKHEQRGLLISYSAPNKHPILMTWLIILSALLLVTIVVILFGLAMAKTDWGSWSVNWIDGWLRFLCRVVHRLPATHIPLPKTGGAIVAANHVSGLDPFLLIAASRRPLRFLIAREEYEKPILHWMFKASGCIPVDRSGNSEMALRQAMRALQAGEVIALFPHGKIHLDTDPPRKLKGGVARLATWSGKLIFPIRIDGVGGKGRVTLAPFIPSHVQLSITKPFFCQPDQMDTCLEKIEHIISEREL